MHYYFHSLQCDVPMFFSILLFIMTIKKVLARNHMHSEALAYHGTYTYPHFGFASMNFDFLLQEFILRNINSWECLEHEAK